MRILGSSRSSAVATVIAASLLGFRTFNTKANAEAKDHQQSAQSNIPESTGSQSGTTAKRYTIPGTYTD
jgi:hypothetical protein